jgi:heme exporter protein A
MIIEAKNLARRFGMNRLFKNINFTVETGHCLAITGRNGSGKTTLIRIIAGLLPPSLGKITFLENARLILPVNLNEHLGLIGPYVEWYQELTALDNIRFAAKMHGLSPTINFIQEQFNEFGLAEKQDVQLKNYSSGMKQRLKYIAATIHSPHILLVDEARANLDKQGIEKIYTLLDRQKKNGILILATNDPQDLEFADEVIRIDA